MAEGDTKMMTDEFERAFAAKKDTFTVKYRLPQFQILTAKSIERFYIDFEKYFKEEHGKPPDPTPDRPTQRPSRMTGIDMATPSVDHI